MASQVIFANTWRHARFFFFQSTTHYCTESMKKKNLSQKETFPVMLKKKQVSLVTVRHKKHIF
jgi:hypothetical protein